MKEDYARLFNEDWKFLLGDAKNAHQIDFCDRTWKHVDLPHDWVIQQPFDKGESSGQNMQGFFVWDKVCWYRKEFTLPNLAGTEAYLYFGGAYRNSTVYVNGRAAGGRAYGYSSFELDISAFVHEGKNLIALRLDNGCEAPDRWYSGGGLYRNVFLKIVPITHIKTWGLRIKTVVSNKMADVQVEACIVSGNTKAKGNVILRLVDPNGKCIAENQAQFNLNNKTETLVTQNFRIQNPALWSAETPNVYRVCAQLETEGAMIQPVYESFGIRAVGIGYNAGMTVNGEKIKLKGVCLHHDGGITGSAYYDTLWRRRLLTLKGIGCNAIRTSHNPPAEEFLDLCDELGFYVIDECFDKWKSGYYAEHFDTDAEKDLQDMILRDRNHPCIVIWSIGNEVGNQGSDSMMAMQKMLTGAVRKLDDRPVTCALEPHVRELAGAPASRLVQLTKKMARDVDVLGLNYHEPLYQDYAKSINKPILGTECYEFYSAVETNFDDISEKNPWRFVLENDNVIGQFIWAGVDYLGESIWPAKGWAGAILDICGFMKPNAFLRKSIWTREPMIYLAFYDQHIKPDFARGRWSFPKMSSHLNHEYFLQQSVKAAIFTNCDEAALFINGKRMGVRKTKDFNNGIIEWNFEYQTGEIEVKGYIQGKEVCNYALKTAGPAKKINLKPDRKKIKPGDIVHVEVNITDKAGLLCPNEALQVEFSLTGDGWILGACSPDLTQNLGFTLPKTITSGGKALVIIKACAGKLELAAYCTGFENAVLPITVE
jgi:beta-galactosidase